jgi:hypothetical protein
MSRRTSRRQSFYRFQRLRRIIARFVRESYDGWQASIEQAHRDMIVTGFGAVVVWDRGDGQGFTAEPLREGEWPKAMMRAGSAEFG